MKDAKYQEALANKVLTSLEKNEDRDYQKEVLSSTSKEQLEVLKKVTEARKEPLTKQSERDHKDAIEIALEAVDGYAYIAGHPRDRTISKEERKLSDISSAISEEIGNKTIQQNAARERAEQEKATQPRQEQSKWTEREDIKSRRSNEEFVERDSFVAKTRVAVQGNFDIPAIPEERSVSFIDAEAQREFQRNNPSQQQNGRT